MFVLLWIISRAPWKVLLSRIVSWAGLQDIYSNLLWWCWSCTTECPFRQAVLPQPLPLRKFAFFHDCKGLHWNKHFSVLNNWSCLALFHLKSWIMKIHDHLKTYNILGDFHSSFKLGLHMVIINRWSSSYPCIFCLILLRSNQSM